MLLSDFQKNHNFYYVFNKPKMSLLIIDSKETNKLNFQAGFFFYAIEKNNSQQRLRNEFSNLG